jgi:hypothetical protein
MSPQTVVMIDLTKKLIEMDPERKANLEAFIRSQKLHDYLARCLDIGQLVNGVSSAEHPITAADLLAWVRMPIPSRPVAPPRSLPCIQVAPPPF